MLENTFYNGQVFLNLQKINRNLQKLAFHKTFFNFIDNYLVGYHNYNIQ